MKEFVLAAIMAFFAMPAVGDIASRNIALQMRLVHDGFLQGSTDGAIGPATRAAIAAYAAKFKIDASRKAVEEHIQRRAAASRVVMIEDDLWAAAIEGAKWTLKDPFSAHFTRLYQFKSAKGNDVVCGLVNAKNDYGAYVGDQFFQSIVLNAHYQMAVGTLERSLEMCDFGVSLDDFRK